MGDARAAVPDPTAARASDADAVDPAIGGADDGDDPPSASSLLVWALAAFHAAMLVALVVVALFFAGLAGNQLAALDTSVGVLAYLYLWGVTWWTNRRMLEAVGPALVTGSAERSGVLVDAMKWGAVVGFLVFLPALAIVTVLFVGAGGLEAVPFILFAAAAGTVASGAVGVVVGALFALLDLLLVRLAAAWLPGGGPEMPTDP